MRQNLFTALALLALTTSAFAQSPAQAPHAAYTTADTDIGTLLDDAAARAILDKHIPNFSTGDGIEMARGMTLRAIQPFAADVITDEKLTAIDADLAALAAKTK